MVICAPSPNEDFEPSEPNGVLAELGRAEEGGIDGPKSRSRSVGAGTRMSPGFRAPELNGAGLLSNVLLPGGVEGPGSGEAGVGPIGAAEGVGLHVGAAPDGGPSCGCGKLGPGVTIVPPGGGAAYPGGGE